ncbi:ATP-binding protein [Geobacter pickeringii]|uniref:ATP-binding protein n=1 Tax=Geobacter pickeringii TaxID=345632 RepID=UPI00068E65E6|nr:ATP-binding protein [Geobacter pickeringii]
MTISSSQSPLLSANTAELRRLVDELRDEVARRTHVEEDLRRSFAEASAAAKGGGELLAHASHEMRTQLQVMSGALELLGETPLSSPQHDYVNQCRQANALLLAFVNDILEFSRMDAGQLSLDLAEFSPIELLRVTTDMLGALARSKGLKLQWQATSDIPEVVRGDARRLQQVMINLVGNAIKFTREGSITISAAREAAPSAPCALRFTVEDTGIGIPGAQINQIFEPFAQLHGSASTQPNGTGLGLAIAQKLIDLMSGTVQVESEEGKGSRFTFIVPFELPAGAVEQQQAPALSPRKPDIWGLHILLAEDSADIRQLVTVFLTSSGHRVEAVANGEEAVDKFTTGNFDVVLMDMQMPVLDGCAATKLIREWERMHGTGPVPILALTAHAERSDLNRSREAGCTAHLAKPIRKEVLLRTVAAHIGA